MRRRPPWRSAYVVFVSGKVVSLPDMHTSREEPCVVRWKRSVYVFGGRDDCCNNEQLTLTASPVWMKLTNSQYPHVGCSPVALHNQIYLCGVKVEVFNPANSQFSVLCTATPLTPALVTYAHDNKIVVICHQVTHILTVSKSDLTVQSTPNHVLASLPPESTQSVKWDGRVWVWTPRSGLSTFQASTGQLLK